MSDVAYKGGQTTDVNGDTQYNFGQHQPPMLRDVYFDYTDTQIYVGSVVQFKENANPQSFTGGVGFDVDKVAGATIKDARTLAGVVVDLKETGGTEDGWITVAVLQVGYVYTFAVAVAIDAGDGLVLANNGQYFDDGGAYDPDTDQAYALYDEDNANNPHGTSAVDGSAIGLVEAIWTGYGDALT